jgi:phage-related tail fiber protein
VVNITPNGLAAMDNLTLTAGMRVLLTAQTNPALNGVFVAGTGAWVRASDANTAASLKDAHVLVKNANGLPPNAVPVPRTIWYQRLAITTLGTSQILFQVCFETASDVNYATFFDPNLGQNVTLSFWNGIMYEVGL